MNDANQLIALVTGASDGIGKEVSKQLAQKGMKVILGVRNLHKGQEVLDEFLAQDLNVELVLLDVNDEISIELAAVQINNRYNHIDILVNNAGIFLDSGPISEMKIKDFTSTFDTNVSGFLRVSQAFIPLLKRSSLARIVNVSSSLASLSNMTDENNPYASISLPSYAASKAAMNVLTIHLARELQAFNIKVNAVCPGLTATRYVNTPGAQPVSVGAEVPVKYALLDANGPTGGFFDRNGSVNW